MYSDQSPQCFVIGHRNPDTDAICSAIGYADFLQQTGMPGVEAARCGNVNARTEWVLEQAGISAPRLIMDVRPTAGGICHREVTKAHVDETFLDVYQRMMQQDYRSIPVVDYEGRVVGMPSMREILGLLMPDDADQMRSRARYVRTSLTHLTTALRGKLVSGVRPDDEEDMVMTVAASSWETFRARTERFKSERMLVVVGDRPSLQRLAIDEGIRVLVLTGGFELAEPDLELARRKEVSVIYCEQDTATTTQLIRCSRRVGSSEFEAFDSFAPGDLVSAVSRLVRESAQPLFPVLSEPSGRLEGVFSKSDLLNPTRTRLVLVDHNEFSQAVKGADEAEILEVIDHHRLSGNLVTKEPVRFINEPLGSTSTIVARMYQQRGLKPPREVAICLCAGMISDTLKLTSPTTTDVEREMLPWLAELGEIDVDEFATGFFSAGSALQSLPPEEALESDRKAYEESGFRISISQIEELGLRHFEAKHEELAATLEEMRKTDELDFACAMVTDITKNNSMLLTAGDERVIDRIEYPRLGNGVFLLEGVVSRKKQLFPALSRVLGGVERADGPVAVDA